MELETYLSHKTSNETRYATFYERIRVSESFAENMLLKTP